MEKPKWGFFEEEEEVVVIILQSNPLNIRWAMHRITSDEHIFVMQALEVPVR